MLDDLFANSVRGAIKATRRKTRITQTYPMPSIREKLEITFSVGNGYSLFNPINIISVAVKNMAKKIHVGMTSLMNLRAT